MWQANYVADQMKIALPPVVIWRPHDRYLGLGQLEALLTLKKLAGGFGQLHRKAADATLRKELGTIQQRIEELEIRKKEITSSTGELAQKVNEIKDLAKKQDMVRRESNSAMLARHLGLLENSERVMTLHPCIIDYAVNLELSNVSEQWEASLRTPGDLESDIIFRTEMDQRLSQLGLQSFWPRLMEEIKHDGIE